MKVTGGDLDAREKAKKKKRINNQHILTNDSIGWEKGKRTRKKNSAENSTRRAPIRGNLGKRDSGKDLPPHPQEKRTKRPRKSHGTVQADLIFSLRSGLCRYMRNKDREGVEQGEGMARV